MPCDLVFLGPPGAGKGTQARALAERRDLPHISTGDLLRGAVAKGTELGLQAKGFLDQGQLVPDDVVCGMVREMIGSDVGARGFILDSFPRTLGQAEILAADLEALGRELTAVVNFELENGAVLERLGGRETCRSCGAMYHKVHNSPAIAGVCDACGGVVYVRDDDNPEIIRKRLQEYRAKTAPLVAWYQERGLLRELSADGSMETVRSALERVLADA